MTPAVVGIAVSFDQPILFETVEEADELAAVEPERIGDLGLRLARLFREQLEHAVVVRREPLLLECLHRTGLHGEAEAHEQEAGPRDQPLRHPRRRTDDLLCLWRVHRTERSVARQIVVLLYR